MASCSAFMHSVRDDGYDLRLRQRDGAVLLLGLTQLVVQLLQAAAHQRCGPNNNGPQQHHQPGKPGIQRPQDHHSGCQPRYHSRGAGHDAQDPVVHFCDIIIQAVQQLRAVIGGYRCIIAMEQSVKKTLFPVPLQIGPEPLFQVTEYRQANIR